MTYLKDWMIVITLMVTALLAACSGGSDCDDGGTDGDAAMDGDTVMDGDLDGDLVVDGDGMVDGDAMTDGDTVSPPDGDYESIIDGDLDGANVPDKDRDGFSEAEGDCNDRVPSIHPGAPDIPDLDAVDSNCDGKDGNIDLDRYLSASAKLADFNMAMAQCTAVAGCHILVEQSYFLFADSLSLTGGTRMYGGYKDDFTKREIIDPNLDVYTTTIVLAGDDVQRTIIIEDQSDVVLLDGFLIIAPDAPSITGDSYGLWIKGSDDVRIRRCRIEGGQTADAAGGSDGVDGAAGNNAFIYGAESVHENDGGDGGYQSYNGHESSWYASRKRADTCHYWNQNPWGGKDICGLYHPELPTCDPTVDDPGNCRTKDGRTREVLNLDSCQTKAVNTDAQYCWCIYDPDPDYAITKGGNGVFLEKQHGCHGQCGVGGMKAAATGIVGEDGFWEDTSESAGNGTAGSYGQGGAGGVAGGFYMCIAKPSIGSDHLALTQPGGPGGGGGAGGWFGSGGTAGEHAYSSFAVMITQSTVDMIDVEIELGAGGEGGDGGNGGDGGDGGNGGAGWTACPVIGPISHFDCGVANPTLNSECGMNVGNWWETKWNGGKGAPGGDGGNAGSGGGAAGGNGGSVYGIVYTDSSIHQENVTYSGGTPGSGGAGGSTGASNSTKTSCSASGLDGEDGLSGEKKEYYEFISN